MATTTVRVDGLRQLGERMRKLSSDIAKRSATLATGAAARVIKKHAKLNLERNPSTETRLVYDNVIIKKLRKRDTTLTSEHIVTVKKKVYPTNNKSGKRNTRRAAQYLEFGTVSQPAEPFLRPAIEQNKDEATTAMVNKLRERIAKAEGGR